MIRLKIILLSIFLLTSVSLFSQTQRIVVKLKQNTPQNILIDFSQNTLKGHQNSLSKIIERFDIFNSEQLFKKFISKLKPAELSGLDRILYCRPILKMLMLALMILNRTFMLITLK